MSYQIKYLKYKNKCLIIRDKLNNLIKQLKEEHESKQNINLNKECENNLTDEINQNNIVKSVIDDLVNKIIINFDNKETESINQINDNSIDPRLLTSL